MKRPELVPPGRPASAQPAQPSKMAAPAQAAAPKARTPAQIAAQQHAMQIMRERNAAKAAAKATGQPVPAVATGKSKTAAPAYDLPERKSKATGKGGKKVTAGLRPEPAPQNCTVCGYPRKFIGYQTKTGKDGRVAKWPGFEVCPNLNDPQLHPHKPKVDRLVIAGLPAGAPVDYGKMTGNATASMFEFAGSAGDKRDNRTLRPLPKRDPSPPMMWYNLEDASIADAWGTMLPDTIEHLGAAPKYLYVHPDELASRLAEKNLPQGVEIRGRRNVMHQYVATSIQPQRDLPALKAA